MNHPYRFGVASPAPAGPDDGPPGDTPWNPGATSLGAQERAVLTVLLENHNRVVGRRELARQAGLAGLNERRCDSLLVGLRRVLGGDAIVTVRSRGWMLNASAVSRATELLGGAAPREARDVERRVDRRHSLLSTHDRDGNSVRAT